jgi:hypothetical protein
VKPVRLCLWIVALLSCAEAAADTDVGRARKYKKMSAEPLIREMSETCWRAGETQEWRRKLQALPDDPARVREFVHELDRLKFPCRQVKRDRDEEEARRAKLVEAEQRAKRETGQRAAEAARKKAGFEWVIRPRFAGAGEFAANGLARVAVNGKWGWINEKGEEVIEPRFDEAWSFAANGLAPVKVNGKEGYINEKGEEVIKPHFDDAWYFAARPGAGRGEWAIGLHPRPFTLPDGQASPGVTDCPGKRRAVHHLPWQGGTAAGIAMALAGLVIPSFPAPARHHLPGPRDGRTDRNPGLDSGRVFDKTYACHACFPARKALSCPTCNSQI